MCVNDAHCGNNTETRGFLGVGAAWSRRPGRGVTGEGAGGGSGRTFWPTFPFCEGDQYATLLFRDDLM